MSWHHAQLSVGDLTTHGGRVIGGFPTMLIHGKTVAGVGHIGYCPRCKTIFTIVQCSGKALYFGHQVAFEGMLTSSRARLIVSQSECVVDDELGGSSIFAGAVTPPITKTATEKQPQHYRLE